MTRFMSSGFFNWTFAGAPVSVDLDLALLQRLRREILRQGDQQTYGVLLGSVTPDSPIRVRVTGFRPSPKQTLPTTVRTLRAGPVFPVGYYRYRGRDRIHLDEDDLLIAQSCFTDPGDVFLMSRSGAPGEATAGVFFWDDGKIHSDFSFLEFPLNAGDLREPVPSGLANNKRRWALAGVGVLALLALAALFGPWRSAPPTPGRAETLGLRYEARGSQVRVNWDKSLALIRAAQTGILSIREGSHETTVPLAGDQLRTGSVVYTRMGGGDSVRFRLEVTDAQSNRSSEDLMAQLPPENVGAKASRRGPPESPRIEIAEPEPAPPVPSPATKSFQAPTRSNSARETTPPSPDLPSVSLPGAANASLPESITPPRPPPPKALVLTPAKAIRVVRPPLPANVAAMVRAKTRVQVKVTLDRSGNVVAAEPVATDPAARLLGNIVATAARNWRFEPARLDGVPAAGSLIVNVDYEPGGK
jgi:hypothetical protein